MIQQEVIYKRKL